MTRGSRRGFATLTLIGLGIAVYLTYVHYSGTRPLCSSGGCETVESSRYAELAGVPVALLGAILYAAILITTAFSQRPIARAALAGLTSGGAAFSLYLTYRELFTLRAVCIWCLASAAVMIVLAGLALTRFLQDSPP